MRGRCSNIWGRRGGFHWSEMRSNENAETGELLLTVLLIASATLLLEPIRVSVLWRIQ